MEIEKPFKCDTCEAKFINEDHLQVHKKKHAFSLNLNKTNGLCDFIDETPTPSRFFRNCDELGLFQDLQNVNPFDEQFVKEVQTPNSEVSFKRVDDTLNTPQVIFYAPPHNSQLPSSTSISSIINSNLSLTTPNEALESSTNEIDISIDKEKDNISNTSVRFIEVQSEQIKKSTETSVSKTVIHESNKRKRNLTLTLGLNLSPHNVSSQSSSEICTSANSSTNEKAKNKIPSQKFEQSQKNELLERNRAAASRSRQKRKIWVTNLEIRCSNLETLLASTQEELSRVKKENKMLKNTLAHHDKCDITIAQNEKSTFMHKEGGDKDKGVIDSPKIENPLFISQPQTQFILNNIQVIPKAKRGRPRKGTEKKINPIQIHSSVIHPMPLKVQIIDQQNNLTFCQHGQDQDISSQSQQQPTRIILTDGMLSKMQFSNTNKS